MAQMIADQAAEFLTNQESEKEIGLDLEQIAAIAHELNAEFCRCIGDHSQVAWEESPAWQKTSCYAGAMDILNGVIKSPGESHESWLAIKTKDGWKHGKAKDPDKKEHPCMMPFSDLPKFQQVKDLLFFNTVKSLSKIWNGK